LWSSCLTTPLEAGVVRHASGRVGAETIAHAAREPTWPAIATQQARRRVSHRPAPAWPCSSRLTFGSAASGATLRTAATSALVPEVGAPCPSTWWTGAPAVPWRVGPRGRCSLLLATCTCPPIATRQTRRPAEASRTMTPSAPTLAPIGAERGGAK
jgi:hypothetical protein